MQENKHILELFNNLRIMRMHFGFYYSRILSKEKLSLQNYTMMLLINNTLEPINMKTIATKLGVTNPAVTHFVDILEKRAFITRVPSTTDRRVTYLELTPTGKTFIETIEQRCFDVLSKTFFELDELTRKNVNLFYKTIVKNLAEELTHESQ
jgi:DNA-binding MarR family transcriptional regulator